MTPDDPDPIEAPVASMIMFAEVDGVLTDFSWEGDFEIDLEASIRDGNMSITGFTDPDGLGLNSACATCTLLNIDLFHELGVALTTGTYPVENFGPTGLRSEATYTPSFAVSSTAFGSNDSDPNTQPWSGEIVVGTLTADAVVGTFEFVLYDGGATGPPYPEVTITNGSFRLSLD